jgi:NitT/TauT family transport system substrate-binding protein
MRRTWTAIVIATSVVLAACGGTPGAAPTGSPADAPTAAITGSPQGAPVATPDSSPSASQGTPGTSATTLRVSLIPIIDVAPLYLAIDKGWFAAEGLTVEPQIAQTGAATAAAVVSGEQQIGFAAIAPLLQAQVQGLPLELVAPSISSLPAEPPDPNGNNPVVVRSDSDIETAADLNGRTIAVNALQAVAELIVRASADRLGADSSTFEFVAIPFPEMIAALEAGRVDAIALVPPFYEAALGAGHRAAFFSYPYDDDARFPLAAWFTSSDVISSDPDAIERFARLMREANAYAQEHPEEVRAIVPTYTQIPEAVAQNIFLPEFDAELDVAGIEREAQLMVEYGFVDEQPDVAALVGDS